MLKLMEIILDSMAEELMAISVEETRLFIEFEVRLLDPAYGTLARK